MGTPPRGTLGPVVGVVHRTRRAEHRAPRTYSQKTLGEGWLGNQRRDVELAPGSHPPRSPLATSELTGVFLGDSPMDLSEFELREEQKLYREWCVPARTVDRLLYGE